MLHRSDHDIDAASVPDQHPPAVDFVELSRGADFLPPHAASPTVACPGSKAKLAVMQARYRNGQELHHSEDASWVDRSSKESQT